MPTISELIKAYDLRPHPEGGYFRETYRSRVRIPEMALPRIFKGDRSCATAIYFLLPKGSKSCLHRIKSDEIWHFYLGGALTIVQISPSGGAEEIILGPNIKNGQKLQHVVPGGYWFGAYPSPRSSYSFVGCTVAPGFDFTDFEIGNREELLGRFPHAQEMIERLTDKRDAGPLSA